MKITSYNLLNLEIYLVKLDLDDRGLVQFLWRLTFLSAELNGGGYRRVASVRQEAEVGSGSHLLTQ